MDNPTGRKANNGDPIPEGLLTVMEIARLYGISHQAVRRWKLKPAFRVPWGRRWQPLYLAADVEAYVSTMKHPGKTANKIDD